MGSVLNLTSVIIKEKGKIIGGIRKVSLFRSDGFKAKNASCSINKL